MSAAAVPLLLVLAVIAVTGFRIEVWERRQSRRVGPASDHGLGLHLAGTRSWHPTAKDEAPLSPGQLSRGSSVNSRRSRA